MKIEDLERYDELMPRNSLWTLVSIDDFGHGTLEFEIHFENIEVLIEVTRKDSIRKIYTNALPANLVSPNLEGLLRFNSDALYQIDEDIEDAIAFTNLTQLVPNTQSGNLLTLFAETGGPVFCLKHISTNQYLLTFQSQKDVIFEMKKRTIFTAEHK